MILIALGQVVTAKTRMGLHRIAENQGGIPEDFTERLKIPVTRLPIEDSLASVLRTRNPAIGGQETHEIPTGPWICYRSAIGLRLSGLGWGTADAICEDFVKLIQDNGGTTENRVEALGTQPQKTSVETALQPEGWAWTKGIESNLAGSVTTGAWTVAPQSIGLRIEARSPWLDLTIEGAGLVTWLQAAQGPAQIETPQLKEQPESLQIAWGICDRMVAMADREGWAIGLDLASLQGLIAANGGTIPLIEGLLSWSDGLFDAGLLDAGLLDASLWKEDLATADNPKPWTRPKSQEQAIARGIDQLYRGLPIAGERLRGDVALRSAQLALFDIARTWLAFGLSTQP
jgi:hypothetical protein